MAGPEDESVLQDDEDESLWTSPIKSEILPVSTRAKGSRENDMLAKGGQHGTSDATSKEMDEENLRQELASVRRVNEALEGVMESLERAKRNMSSVNQTVGAASSLLNIWTRILSQTEHNQRLILDPSWQGASQDIVNMEEELAAKQQAAERREIEEQERRATAARKAEEDERKRAEAAVLKPKSSVRGRTGIGRGTSVSRANTNPTSSANNTSSSMLRGSSTSRRGSSGIGRTTRGTRGKG